MGEEDYVIPHEVFLKIERRPDKFRYYNAIYVVVKHCVEYAEAEQYAAARREYLSLLSARNEQFLRRTDFIGGLQHCAGARRIFRRAPAHFNAVYGEKSV